ncbi:hypothetical protein HK405_011761 [Cladochytrium tenue]|nr:hypothetical protein HK405_011761 [Cladochytrium tenue]
MARTSFASALLHRRHRRRLPCSMPPPHRSPGPILSRGPRTRLAASLAATITTAVALATSFPAASLAATADQLPACLTSTSRSFADWGMQQQVKLDISDCCTGFTYAGLQNLLPGSTATLSSSSSSSVLCYCFNDGVLPNLTSADQSCSNCTIKVEFECGVTSSAIEVYEVSSLGGQAASARTMLLDTSLTPSGTTAETSVGGTLQTSPASSSSSSPSDSTSGSTSSSSGTNVALIAGVSAAGAVVLLAAVAFAVFVARRRRGGGGSGPQMSSEQHIPLAAGMRGGPDIGAGGVGGAAAASAAAAAAAAAGIGGSKSPDSMGTRSFNSFAGSTVPLVAAPGGTPRGSSDLLAAASVVAMAGGAASEVGGGAAGASAASAAAAGGAALDAEDVEALEVLAANPDADLPLRLTTVSTVADGRFVRPPTERENLHASYDDVDDVAEPLA